MGRLQRDDCRSGRRLHVLVHQHVLSRAGSELGHAHWIVQILILRRGTDSDSNGHSWWDTDPDCHSNRDAHHKRWDTDCHSNRDAHRNSNSYTDCNADSHTNCHPNCNSNRYSNSNGNSDNDTNSNSYPVH
jgi:hypothetical protein